MPLFSGDNFDPRNWNWKALNLRDMWRYRHVRIAAAAIGILILASIMAIRFLGSPDEPKPLGEEPSLRVFFHETGEIRTMSIETYIEGVVAAEMDPEWPTEALAAQAIIARTFTVRGMEDGGVPGRNADASTDHTEFQAYDAARVNDRVRAAVESTRGEIITYQDRPALAWFHASSGGRTATPQEGLGFDGEDTPYLRVVDDLDETEDVQWDHEFPVNEIERAASSLGHNVSPLREVAIDETGPSGRAVTVRLNDQSVPAPELRLSLGPTRMRSTLLEDLEISNGTVAMSGRGFGHGVGLSQWGAWVMAQRGISAEDIVLFYYKGVDIVRRW